MNLVDLDLAEATLIKLKELVINNQQSTVKIYEKNGLVYKLWDKVYQDNLVNSVGSNWVLTEKPNSIFGFDIGYYDSENASAFIEYIKKDDDVLGYICFKGEDVVELDGDFMETHTYIKFIEDAWIRALKVGWIPSDICANNITLIGHKISFIDFDGHMTKLADLNYEHEIKFGVLRRHIAPFLRGLISGYMKIYS